MQIIYINKKVEKQCTDQKTANILFGGNKQLVNSLFARINALNAAETIKDIIVQPQFRFHNLLNFGKGKDLEGYFAIDVKTKFEKWRIILQPLDENKKPFYPCRIDEIASIVKIVEIREVSNHYE